MPIPDNITIETAQELGATAPVTVTEAADFGGLTYELWFKRTVLEGEVEWSIFAFGDLSVYLPSTAAMRGPEGSPAVIQSGGSNLTILVSVTERVGEVIYLRISTNAGNPTPANLTLSLEVKTDASVPVGSIAVNEDNDGYPAVFFNSSTGATITYRQPFPASDFADVLPNGRLLALNLATDTWTLFDANLNAIATPAVGTGFTRVSSNQRDTFYVGNATTGVVKTVGIDGTVGATSWDVGATLWAIAPSWDDTILYYVAVATAAAPIKRWDLVTDMALSDLAAGVADHTSTKTLMVTGDNEILAGYRKTTATADYFCGLYTALGATVDTFSFGTTQLNQMNHAIDDPNSFWVWLFNSDATFTFRNIKISDGSTLGEITTQDYTGGVYQGSVTATPDRWGNSSSCQFWITRGPVNPETITYPIRRQRRFLLPSDPDNRVMFLHRLELLLRTGIGLTAGPPDAPVQGSDPQVMMRLSRDGGMTWTSERWVSAGAIGKYLTRARWLSNGRYRNAVCEITVSDPVDWQFLAMSADLEAGSS